MHVNDIWGSSLAKAATASYKDYGYSAIKTVAYPTNVSDLKSEVLQLKRDNPDVILQASFDTDAIIAVKAYQALQLQPKAILAMGASFSTPEFINALGKLANFAFSHTKFHAVLLEKRRGATQINEEYKKRTGRPLWDAPARAFTATMVIADALNRAKSLSREDIIAALKETRHSRRGHHRSLQGRQVRCPRAERACQRSDHANPGRQALRRMAGRCCRAASDVSDSGMGCPLSCRNCNRNGSGRYGHGALTFPFSA